MLLFHVCYPWLEYTRNKHEEKEKKRKKIRFENAERKRRGWFEEIRAKKEEKWSRIVFNFSVRTGKKYTNNGFWGLFYG